MAVRIKKDDLVQVIAGKNRGDRGRVKKVLRAENRVVIEGVNVVKRHRRAVGNTPGGIVEFEAPIHISNVLPVDKKSDKPTRVRFEASKEGKKQRVAVRSGAALEA